MSSLVSMVELVETISAAKAARIIGIAGSPGAGKSTIAAALVAQLSGAVLLAADGFHLSQARLVELGRRERMGAPDTFDVDGFVELLGDIRAGKPVSAPNFDRTTEEPVANAIQIESANTVIVEGNYLLLDSGGWERVAPLLDLTFFVEVDRELRLQRLIDRHVAFGKTRDAATAWSLGPDEQNARLIEATAARADHRIALRSA